MRLFAACASYLLASMLACAAHAGAEPGSESLELRDLYIGTFEWEAWEVDQLSLLRIETTHTCEDGSVVAYGTAQFETDNRFSSVRVVISVKPDRQFEMWELHELRSPYEGTHKGKLSTDGARIVASWTASNSGLTAALRLHSPIGSERPWFGQLAASADPD